MSWVPKGPDVSRMRKALIPEPVPVSWSFRLVEKDMTRIVQHRDTQFIVVYCGSSHSSSSFAKAHRLAAELWAAGLQCHVVGQPGVNPNSEDRVRVRHVPPRVAGEKRDWEGSLRVIRARVQNYLGDFTEERV